MKAFTLAAILALPAAAFAQSDAGTSTKGAPDAMHFCYIGGQPYSEGAKANNLVCVRPRNVANAFDTTLLPLRWEDAPRSK